MQEQPGSQPTDQASSGTPPVPLQTAVYNEPSAAPAAPAQPLSPPVPVPQQSAPLATTLPQPVTLEWHASEYVEHAKSTTWFITLGLITVALLAVAIWLLKDYSFALLVVVMAVAVAVWAKRPAHELQYRLSAQNVMVGEKSFSLHDFRGFGVLQEGGLYTVTLLPVKRFRPGVNIYFPEELGEQIVDILGSRLPMEHLQPDFIDRITNRLNF